MGEGEKKKKYKNRYGTKSKDKIIKKKKEKKEEEKKQENVEKSSDFALNSDDLPEKKSVKNDESNSTEQELSNKADKTIEDISPPDFVFESDNLKAKYQAKKDEMKPKDKEPKNKKEKKR